MRHFMREIRDYEVVTGGGGTVGCIQAMDYVDANEADRSDSASCDRARGRIGKNALVRRQIRALSENEQLQGKHGRFAKVQ